MNLLTHLFRWGSFIGIGCFLFAFVLLLRNSLLPRSFYEVPLVRLGLHGEEISFKSRGDGLKISGTLLKRGEKDPVIILCHGLGANRYDLIETASILYGKGTFTIFLFDFRAHGKSQGSLTSFGHHEQKDLLGALDYLDTRKDLSHRYGVFGVSMGGSVSILVAAREFRIQALCVDSPFLDLKKSITKQIELLTPLPKFPFLPLIFLSYNLLFWTDVATVSPLNAVDKISPRPLYLLNGSEDNRMTAEGARVLYQRAREPKKLWLVPGAGHLEGRLVAGKEYEESILHFFENSLREDKSNKKEVSL